MMAATKAYWKRVGILMVLLTAGLVAFALIIRGIEWLVAHVQWTEYMFRGLLAFGLIFSVACFLAHSAEPN